MRMMRSICEMEMMSLIHHEYCTMKVIYSVLICLISSMTHHKMHTSFHAYVVPYNLVMSKLKTISSAPFCRVMLSSVSTNVSSLYFTSFTINLCHSLSITVSYMLWSCHAGKASMNLSRFFRHVFTSRPIMHQLKNYPLSHSCHVFPPFPSIHQLKSYLPLSISLHVPSWCVNSKLC